MESSLFTLILLFCLIQLSYYVVNLIIWWSMRTFINDFRKKKLKLSPIAYFSTYNGSISHLPTGYMWSPHLVPKPSGEDGLLILLPCTLSFYYILNGNFGTHISLPPWFASIELLALFFFFFWVVVILLASFRMSKWRGFILHTRVVYFSLLDIRYFRKLEVPSFLLIFYSNNF